MCERVFSSACRRPVASLGQMTDKKEGCGPSARLQCVNEHPLHVDSDNKAVSFMQQVSSAAIIREAGHTHICTHTSAAGQGQWAGRSTAA